jgi:hypothetical protein
MEKADSYEAQIAAESDAQCGRAKGFKRARAEDSVASTLARKRRVPPLTEASVPLRQRMLGDSALLEQRLFCLLQREEELALQLVEETRVSAAVRALVSEIESYRIRMEEDDLG